MEFWMLFWKVVFIVTLLLFAVLAVVVTIGGFKDIIALFRAMDKENQKLDDRES